ncbi:hypothetical protein PPS_2892 [Pseudomonas putida S16]|nr:hypothetical protein PPS_2892 [Pseudomonas putida S16]
MGGVFWSAPPTALDDVWSYLPIIPVLVVAVIASLVVGQRIKVKRQQPDWKLRQHMVEIGTAITVVYLFAMFVLVCVRSGQVVTMPLNEVGDFLAGAFGPVAFLWLVLGFLQQGDELRQGTEALRLQATELQNSVAQQKVMADVALEQKEHQRTAQEAQRVRREKEIQVELTLTTGNSGPGRMPGEAMNEIRIFNNGYDAYNVKLTLDAPFDCQQVSFGTVKNGSLESRKLYLSPILPPADGTALVEYEDADGNPKSVTFPYRLSASRRAEFAKP